MRVHREKLEGNKRGKTGVESGEERITRDEGSREERIMGEEMRGQRAKQRAR